jgi:hypothetical protein
MSPAYFESLERYSHSQPFTPSGLSQQDSLQFEMHPSTAKFSPVLKGRESIARTILALDAQRARQC